MVCTNTGWINCILPSIYSTGGDQWVEYSNLSGYFSGEGNINENPLFVDPENGDFHLQIGSPCIDTGSPSPQYNDPDGSRNDMGAYGGPGGDW